MEKIDKSDSTGLRQKAEELLKKKTVKTTLSPSNADTLKFIHELEVHQIELELINEELLRAKEEAEIAKEKYIELYDFAPSGYFTLSKTGKIVDLNLTGATMLGKNRLDLKNSLFGFFVSNNSKPTCNLFLEKVFVNKSKESCELALSAKDNFLKYVYVTGIVIGNGEQCFVTVVDITELKRIEEVLRESERFLKETQQIANLGTFTMDVSSGRWTSSEILDIIFGIESDFDKSVEGWMSIIHPDWQKTINDYFIQEVIGKKMSFDKEYKIIRQNDKAERWVHGKGNLKFNDNNQAIAMVGTIRDVTEHKQAEAIIKNINDQLIIANTDKDRFISILAHDLKSPFSALLGFSNLLKKNIRNYDIDEIERRVNIINISTQNTFNLLEDLLMWAQSRLGKIPCEPKKLNFADICSDVVKILMPNADAKNITINHYVKVKIIVFADIDMLKTILRNLISNAIKFTNPGGHINIYAINDKANVTVTVSDSGIGIAPDILSNLFDITQTHTTNGTANESGTGLGLLLCKEFIDKHGGKIWAESKEGKGSDFKFSLPIAVDKIRST